MRHFPIYLDTSDRIIVVSGAGACAVAKLRLLLKTQATLRVFGEKPEPDVLRWAAERKIELFERRLTDNDLEGALLLYAGVFVVMAAFTLEQFAFRPYEHSLTFASIMSVVATRHFLNMKFGRKVAVQRVEA